ncbi:MAG: hypothetical protein RSC06_11455 [Clostridia bacterium]
MRLPNKVTPYRESILAKFPVVLSKLEHEDVEPSKLFRAAKGKMHDVGEFIEVLDCLYALGKIRLIDEEGVLHYVDRDSV